MEDLHFDLHHTKNIFRTKSRSDLNQTSLETAGLQQSFSREASPSTPPDLQLLHRFSLFHNQSAQNQFVGLSVSSTPIHTTTVQNTPFQPTFPLVNPPTINPPLFLAMAAWYAPLVLPQPIAPLPNDYQSKIPHFTGEKSIAAQQHVTRIGDAFDYMEI